MPNTFHYPIKSNLHPLLRPFAHQQLRSYLHRHTHTRHRIDQRSHPQRPLRRFMLRRNLPQLLKESVNLTRRTFVLLRQFNPPIDEGQAIFHVHIRLRELFRFRHGTRDRQSIAPHTRWILHRRLGKLLHLLLLFDLRIQKSHLGLGPPLLGLVHLSLDDESSSGTEGNVPRFVGTIIVRDGAGRRFVRGLFHLNDVYLHARF
mmetsp:Transcript_25271/g.41445  ORF Transcript_25271/g.41445 Transcript_25271/m.41445 type:complete len:203 (-) Transcript_25271:612-1220(-)